MMDKNLFDRLVNSMTEMDEIARGERKPSREFRVDAVHVKAIREATGLTQEKFARNTIITHFHFPKEDQN